MLRAGHSPKSMSRAASESVRVRGLTTAHARTNPPAYTAHTPGKTPTQSMPQGSRPTTQSLVLIVIVKLASDSNENSPNVSIAFNSNNYDNIGDTDDLNDTS